MGTVLVPFSFSDLLSHFPPYFLQIMCFIKQALYSYLTDELMSISHSPCLKGEIMQDRLESNLMKCRHVLLTDDAHFIQSVFLLHCFSVFIAERKCQPLVFCRYRRISEQACCVQSRSEKSITLHTAVFRAVRLI